MVFALDFDGTLCEDNSPILEQNLPEVQEKWGGDTEKSIVITT